MKERALAPLAALLLAGCATTQTSDRSLDAFERALAAQDSATAALAHWCASHGIASPARITARPSGEAMSAPDEGLRGSLEVGPDEPLGYRHVLLSCGDVVLSDAHNWYVKARLTPSMNEALETTDAPFGTVAAPLHFTRERLSSQRGAAEQCPADTIVSHRALLRLPDGRPISLVVECYTPANLAGPTE